MSLLNPISRRQAIKSIFYFSGSLALGIPGLNAGSSATASQSKVQTPNKGFLVQGEGQSPNYSIPGLVKKVFEEAGGIAQFVSRGDHVVIKPNISWARIPDLAATTNPEILKAIIELCFDAGAKSVKIADNTIHDPSRCFALTGAGRVAKETGADLIYPRSSLMRKTKIGGKRVNVWPVFKPLMEADKVINVPIAKHHSLSKLTLGMKNWIGGVGGSRWALHQDINQSIVDLAKFFKPDLTVIDAINIMTRNGPSGGKPDYVEKKNTVILSNDPVAADAKAAKLFGKAPETIGYIILGENQGLGTYQFDTLTVKQVKI